VIHHPLINRAVLPDEIDEDPPQSGFREPDEDEAESAEEAYEQGYSDGYSEGYSDAEAYNPPPSFDEGDPVG
jgi:hypothetical protein